MEFNASDLFRTQEGEITVKNISVENLVSIYGKLGIPHFQRGFLWGDGYKGYLLESLFSKTPCGTLIFWRSKGDSYGVPLLNDGARPEAYIIDGQQRTRSLYEIFNEEKLKEEIIYINDCISKLDLSNITSEDQDQDDGKVVDSNSDDNEEFNDGLWCINLLALKDKNIASLFTNRKKEYPLFLKRKVFISIKPEESKGSTGPKESKFYAIKNYIPLSLLLFDKFDNNIRKHLIELSKPEFEAEVNKEIKELQNQVKKILKESFILLIIDSPYDEAIQTYIRINNSGIKVSPEEKVFAKLIKEYPDSNNHIKAIFDAIQPSKSGNTERDDYLKRSEEKSFGFKLIIKVFTQVCQYHLGVVTGSDAISYDVFYRTVFTSTEARDKYDYFWEETRDVLKKTKSILENILKIDDFRFLPDTTSLLPIFQLLITYKDLRDDKYDKLIGFLVLYYFTVYTVNFDTRDILGKVRVIGDSKKNFNKIWAMLLDKFIQEDSPLIISEKQLDDLKKKLSIRLEKSNSLEDRYVLLYYAILRLHEAVDFSVKDNEHSGKLIDKKMAPEKQHLIPYSWLKNKDEKARRSYSSINNIGNLTYISFKANRKLMDEPVNSKDNNRILEKHCLSKEFRSGKSRNALDYYNSIVNNSKTKNKKNDGPEDINKKNYAPEDKYIAFIKARRDEIISGEYGIVKALQNLFESSNEILSNAIGEKRLEPTSPLLVKDPIADLIRSFTKDNNEIEDKLIFLSHGNVFEKPEPKSENSLILKLKKKGAFKNIDLEISLDRNNIAFTTNIDELNCFTNKVYDFKQRDTIIPILDLLTTKLIYLKDEKKRKDEGKRGKRNEKKRNGRTRRKQ